MRPGDLIADVVLISRAIVWCQSTSDTDRVKHDHDRWTLLGRNYRCNAHLLWRVTRFVASIGDIPLKCHSGYIDKAVGHERREFQVGNSVGVISVHGSSGHAAPERRSLRIFGEH